jgi:hypothetical protein
MPDQGLWPVASGAGAVDLGAVVDVEDMDGAGVFLDPVGAAAGTVTVG